MKIPKSEIKRKAIQIARRGIVQSIKDKGGKISHYSGTDIDRVAKDMVESDSDFLRMAEIELRETVYGN